MDKRFIALFLLMMVVCAHSGCQENPNRASVDRLLPQPNPPIVDVPVPNDFVQIERAGEAQLTGKARLYVRHVYEGPVSAPAVYRFYLDQMPLNRWVLVNHGNVKGDYSMRFEKGSESCTIDVATRRRGLGSVTAIQIKLLQEQRGESPPQR